MAGETTRNLPPVNQQATDDAKSDYGTESTTPVTSSPTLGAIKMADKKVPEMSDFLNKKTIVTDEEC
jgi:hypothetical protein